MKVACCGFHFNSFHFVPVHFSIILSLRTLFKTQWNVTPVSQYTATHRIESDYRSNSNLYFLGLELRLRPTGVGLSAV